MHALACFLGLDKRCKGRALHRDSRLVVAAGSPRGDKSRLAAKPRPVPALVTYRKRVFAGAGVPDFQITQRRIKGTEM